MAPLDLYFNQGVFMKIAINYQQRLNWVEKIRAQQMSGLSIAMWCKGNQIPPHIFHYWKQNLYSLKKKTIFLILSLPYNISS